MQLKNRSAPDAEEFQTEEDGWYVRLTAAGAQADAYRQPSACGHWRSQTMGADCGLRRPSSGGG